MTTIPKMVAKNEQQNLQTAKHQPKNRKLTMMMTSSWQTTWCLVLRHQYSVTFWLEFFIACCISTIKFAKTVRNNGEIGSHLLIEQNTSSQWRHQCYMCTFYHTLQPSSRQANFRKKFGNGNIGKRVLMYHHSDVINNIYATSRWRHHYPIFDTVAHFAVRLAFAPILRSI